MLKVIKYKNYGYVFGAGEETDIWEHKFYWSFYELNNGEIIGLDNTEYFENSKLIDQEYGFCYTKKELLNGSTHSYKFGNAKSSDNNAMSKEFFKWFDSRPPFHQVRTPTSPTLKEEQCVIEFYKKYISDLKDKKTNTILT